MSKRTVEYQVQNRYCGGWATWSRHVKKSSAVNWIKNHRNLYATSKFRAVKITTEIL